LDSRHSRGTLQYLVAWKGYSDAHNSWEPKRNLRVPQLIQEFYDHNPKAVQRLKVEAAKLKDTKTTPRKRQCQGQQLRVSAPSQLYIRSIKLRKIACLLPHHVLPLLLVLRRRDFISLPLLFDC
jgi:hypothetical protein